MQAETTVIDLAHAAMSAAPDDDVLRLRFYARIAESELFVMIESDEGETVAPRVFELEEGRFILAFDREDRLADFAGAPSPYAALPGRVLVGKLAEEGLGLALNLGVAVSDFMMPAPAVRWLAEHLAQAPRRAAGRPLSLGAADAGPALAAALSGRLAALAGLGTMAALVDARYPDGSRSPALVVIGARPGTEAAIAKSLSEAVLFSGEDLSLDVLFAGAGDAMADEALRVGQVFDLGPPDEAARPAPAAPGSDPARPPILR